MKERPILFSGSMVRAILDGSKTQTRRAVKHIPALGSPEAWCDLRLERLIGDYRRYCPYGVPSDRLWVRESGRMSEGRFFAYAASPGVARCADDKGFITVSPEEAQSWTPEQWRSGGWKPVPSIFMPRWASRLTLEIVSVRVERLQNISEEDAIADGGFKTNAPDSPEFGYLPHDFDPVDCVIPGEDPYDDYWPAIRCFQRLWESINGPGSWESNPWVWVVKFKKLEANQ